jgi:hypothetical protein
MGLAREADLLFDEASCGPGRSSSEAGRAPLGAGGRDHPGVLAASRPILIHGAGVASSLQLLDLPLRNLGFNLRFGFALLPTLSCRVSPQALWDYCCDAKRQANYSRQSSRIACIELLARLQEETGGCAAR